MTELKAFHNDPAIKEKYLARVRAHALADEIVKGKYWEKGKGCAVGCTIHSGKHEAYETELGIPQILARLEDGIFEALPMDRAKRWPEEFLSAIPVGSDLSLVWPRFAIFILTDTEHGVIKLAKTDAQRKAIQDISDAYGRKIAGEKMSSNEWWKLRSAAYAAAAYAAYASAAYAADAAAASAADAASAAYAYAADAAAAYAAAADAAAAYAADASAAYAADAAAARERFRIIQADKLLELLREAK